MDPEIETEETEPPPRTLWDRLHYALGPLAGGMIIDLADFLTPGPVGIFGGLFIGMPVGWYVASMYGFQTPSRLLIATLTGIYCTIPGTELIPVATMISAVGRFFAENQPRPPALKPEETDSPRLKSASSSPIDDSPTPVPQESTPL